MQSKNMYLRKQNGWEFWTGVHPAGIGCSAEGREPCNCKYHIVDTERTKIYSFDDYEAADKKYCELSGSESYVVGKTSFKNWTGE